MSIPLASLNFEPRLSGRKPSNSMKTIIGMPRWMFWSLLSAVLFVLLSPFVAVAMRGDTTVPVRPGERVTVVADTVNGSARDLTRQEAKDVVRALEILLKYAPSKYNSSISLTFGSNSFIMNSSATIPTKADDLRFEARRLDRAAGEKRDEADKIEKEQEEIEWARSVLEKWKLKVASID